MPLKDELNTLRVKATVDVQPKIGINKGGLNYYTKEETDEAISTAIEPVTAQVEALSGSVLEMGGKVDSAVAAAEEAKTSAESASSQVSEVSSKVGEVATNLATEVSTRQSAVDGLSGRIDAEEVARKTVSTNLAAEIARAQEVEALKADVDEVMFVKDVETLPTSFSELDLHTIYRMKGKMYQVVKKSDIGDLYITIEPSSRTAEVGTTFSVKAIVYNYEFDDTVSWSVSNPRIADVDENGRVTVRETGVVEIIATSNEDTGVSNSCVLEAIPKVIPVTGVSLNEHYLEGFPGDTFDLIATVLPSDATNKEVSWSSSDEDIAIVSDGYVLLGDKLGLVNITVRTLDGGYSDICTIKVQEQIEVDEITSAYLKKGSYPTSEESFDIDSNTYVAYNTANFSNIMQFKAASGYIRNISDLGVIKSIELVGVDGKNFSGQLQFSEDGIEYNKTINVTANETYIPDDNYSYFKLYKSTSAAGYLNAVKVTYKPIMPAFASLLRMSVMSLSEDEYVVKELALKDYVDKKVSRKQDALNEHSVVKVQSVQIGEHILDAELLEKLIALLPTEE